VLHKSEATGLVGYLHEIVEEFPHEIGGKATTPADLHLFDKDDDAVALISNDAKIFHQVVAKVLWAATRVCPDLLTALSYLTCQVKAPDQDEKTCQNDYLHSEYDQLTVNNWHE
jgi:hypothetical protein